MIRKQHAAILISGLPLISVSLIAEDNINRHNIVVIVADESSTSAMDETAK